MTPGLRSITWALPAWLVGLLLLMPQSSRGEINAATKPSTQPAATRPAVERDRERLIAIRGVTLAVHDYAETHEGEIPTTGELAKHMEIAPEDFDYRVVPDGLLADHMKRVGGWPEVLIAEKHGGENDRWAFGFVDGMCSIQSVASYEEMENSPALHAISEATTTQPSSSH